MDLQGAFGTSWDLQPKILQWMYVAMVRRVITYEAIEWCPGVGKRDRFRDRLYKVQRLACVGLTGAVRTASIKAL